MDRTIIIETAAAAGDTLAWLQLASAVLVGIVAIYVPARFAARDRALKRQEAIRRAKSFALQYFHDLELLRDYLQKTAEVNNSMVGAVDLSAIAEALTGARDCKVPMAELHLLDGVADPIQTAFGLIKRAESYQLRRGALAQRGEDIKELDDRQAQWLETAYQKLCSGTLTMRALLD
ncbi:hypothetical protein MG068_08260 [Stenotrophomonas sp. ASS1]|uniref:hypothetical protein n=1 Tax=Stenotrophomonas sp. ASS1 TaxID=2282124 RepID=UPI001049E314|nr:hypothetical protein [Stenotrophomonas sp. ASS1]QBL40500.1 hypothetical protein MG068_08260 [Stenotrophomonas sp. ASS1]